MCFPILLLFSTQSLSLDCDKEFDQEYTANDCIINTLISEGCVEIKTTRVQRYTISDNEIQSRRLRTTCEKYNRSTTVTPNTLGDTIHWSRPTTREDGTNLSEEDIAGYEIFIDDKFVAEVESIYEYSLKGYDSGEYSVRLRTIDTNNQYSQFSDPIIIIVN